MQPIPMAYHYSTLSNLQETSKLSVKAATLEHHKTAHTFSKHHKRNNEFRRNGNPTIKHYSVSSFQHPPEFEPNKVRCNVMSKGNGKIMTSEKDKDKVESIQSKLSDMTVKLCNIRKRNFQ